MLVDEMLAEVLIVCPNCGAKLRDLLPSDDPLSFSEVGRTCPRCGWAMVATYCPPMLSDGTRYSLYVKETANPDRSLLHLLSVKVPGVGVVAAKKLITSGDVLIGSGKAPDMHRFAVSLREQGIEYRIEPDYPYDL
jgi:ribosomal protein S27AE